MGRRIVIIESGLIMFFGLLFIAIKLPKRVLLRMLGKPLILDLSVSVAVYLIHWGTFSGVMAAAFAGMMASIFSSLARWIWGYVEKVDGHWEYFPGKIRIDIATLK